MKKEVKEIYFEGRRTRILDKGKDGEFYWVILSLGMHPCSYIGVPKTHPFYGLDYDDIYDKYGYDALDVHGGITFTDPEVHPNPILLENYWFVGWDYGHSGDYACYKGISLNYNDTMHKWTLKELQKELKKALKQIKKVK